MLLFKGVSKVASSLIVAASASATTEVLQATYPPSAVSQKNWSSVKKSTSEALPLPPPQSTDHHKHPNPCLSLYGSQWEAKIKTVSDLSSFTCIVEMVEYLHKVSKEFSGKMSTRKIGISTTMPFHL